jgi:acyl-CoA thioesterase
MKNSSDVDPRQLDPKELAQATARVSRASEPLFDHFGFEVLDMGPGFAKLGMTIRSDMVNAAGVCHGGILFMFADSALGFACNSHNQRALSTTCAIEFIAPARPGDQLIATATEQVLGKRTGLYDVRVETATGSLIALLRGRSATIAGVVIAPPTGD